MSGFRLRGSGADQCSHCEAGNDRSEGDQQGGTVTQWQCRQPDRRRRTGYECEFGPFGSQLHNSVAGLSPQDLGLLHEWATVCLGGTAAWGCGQGGAAEPSIPLDGPAARP